MLLELRNPCVLNRFESLMREIILPQPAIELLECPAADTEYGERPGDFVIVTQILIRIERPFVFRICVFLVNSVNLVSSRAERDLWDGEHGQEWVAAVGVYVGVAADSLI